MPEPLDFLLAPNQLRPPPFLVPSIFWQIRNVVVLPQSLLTARPQRFALSCNRDRKSAPLWPTVGRHLAQLWRYRDRPALWSVRPASLTALLPTPLEVGLI